MNCKDLDDALNQPAPLSREAQEHLQTCDRCRSLVALLGSVPVAAASPATFDSIVQTLRTDLQPVRPIASAQLFFLILLSLSACVTAVSAVHLGTGAISVMTPLQTGFILPTLAGCSILLAFSLAKQMVPGSRQPLSPKIIPFLVSVLLIVAVIALFTFQPEPHFWSHAWSCLKLGSFLGFLTAVPVAFVLNRGILLAPPAAGVAAGFFSGLAGTSLLQIQCPNLNASHILIGHVGASLLCGIAGLIIGLALESLDKNRSRVSSSVS